MSEETEDKELREKLRKEVNANIIRNLRFRWTEELAPWSDAAVLKMYTQFAQSEDWGDNDAKLPEWFNLLPAFEREVLGS